MARAAGNNAMTVSESAMTINGCTIDIMGIEWTRTVKELPPSGGYRVFRPTDLYDSGEIAINFIGTCDDVAALAKWCKSDNVASLEVPGVEDGWSINLVGLDVDVWGGNEEYAIGICYMKPIGSPQKRRRHKKGGCDAHSDPK